MKKILDQIEFLQVDPNMNVQKLKLTPLNGDGSKQRDIKENGEKKSTDYHSKLHVAKHTNICEMFQHLYQQVMDSCNSQIPDPIAQAFLMAPSRLQMKLTHDERENIKKEYQYLGKQIICRSFYLELFNAILRHYLFPFKCPNPDKAVKDSMDKVVRQFRGEDMLMFERQKNTDTT